MQFWLHLAASVSCCQLCAKDCRNELTQWSCSLSVPFSMSEYYHKSHFLLPAKTLLLILFQRRGRASIYSEGSDESNSLQHVHLGAAGSLCTTQRSERGFQPAVSCSGPRVFVVFFVLFFLTLFTSRSSP